MNCRTIIRPGAFATILVFALALLVAALPAALADPTPSPAPSPPDVKSAPPDLSRPSRPATADELSQDRKPLAPIANPTAIRDVIVSNTDTTLASGGSGGSEPSIAVNPANPDQIVISSFFGGWGTNSSIFGSTDGGQTWTVHNSVPAPPGRTGVSGCPCDQTFDFGRNGTLYGTFLLFDGSATNVVTGSTTDFTQASSWSWNGNPVQLTNQAQANNADQPWLLVNRDTATASQDNAYVAYDEFTNNLSRVSVSTGSTPVNIVRDVRAGTASPSVTNPGLRLAADPRNGTMYALYQTSTGASQPRTVTYHLNRSTDAGQTWTLNSNSDGIVVTTAPSDQLQYKFGGVNDLRGGVDHAAVDPTNGDVYVVYGRDTANNGVGNQLEIRRLTDNGSGGLTVGAASVVTNAASAALPSVAVAADGTIGVLYDTFDGTTTAGFPTFTAHFARSTNHGATFTDQVLQTFNSPQLPSGSNTDRQRVLGDFQQLKAVGRTFYGVFSGNRSGFGSTISTIDPIFFSVSARASSNTALTSSVNPSTFGQPVTFTATVSSSAGTPTGSVTFSSDGTPLGTVNLTSGQATLTTAALPAGTHTITADYGGDVNVAPSTGILTQTVNKAPTATALSSSANPSVFGQPTTFTASVTSTAGTPTGSVTFTSDGTPLGTIALVGGQATLTTSALPVGNHTITATYSGDANFLTSSNTLIQTVNKAPTTTTLSSLPNPSTFGSPVTFTATVTVNPPGSGTPSGTVTFSRGSIVLSTRPLDSTGHASMTTTGLQVGTNNITASYSGDASFLPSTSAPLAQTVACSKTVSGLVVGTLNVTNSTCLANATVLGSVTAQPGAALSITKSTIIANLASTGAQAVSVCDSSVTGLTTIRGTTGFVLLGDNGDDGQPSCAGSQFTGVVSLDHNAGQAEIGGSKFLANLTVTNTSGTGPDAETTSTEIEHNTIIGVLSCSGNVPAPTNDGQPNSVLGLRLGQCSAPGF